AEFATDARLGAGLEVHEEGFRRKVRGTVASRPRLSQIGSISTTKTKTGELASFAPRRASPHAAPPAMHVLFDARLLHRPLSGLERVQRNLVRELSRRPEIGRLQVAVLAGTRPPAELGPRAEIVEVHGTEDLLARLLAPVPADRPDVYHLSFFPDRSPRDLLLLPAA